MSEIPEDKKPVDTDDTGDGSKDQTKPDDTTDKRGNMIPQSRFNEVLQQKKDALEQLQSVADSLAEDVPEEFKDIIPDLAPAAKIGWLRNAMKKGLFETKVKNGLDTQRPGGKVPVDLSSMNPDEMLVAGYGKK